MKIFVVIAFFFFSVSILSCRKESEEDIMQDFIYCKDSLVSFSANVQPILNMDCVPCHSGPGAENGVELDHYTGVVDAVSLDMMKMINHEPGFIPMPNNKPKLNECKITTLQKWIDEGMLNN